MSDLLINDNVQSTVLSADTEISLSIIESGCLAISSKKQTIFIIKDNAETLNDMRHIRDITLEWELIKRPEFPTIGLMITIESESGNIKKYDNFFNIDSDEEIKLAKQLSNQNSFNVFFYNECIEHSKSINLTNEHKNKLNILLIQAKL